MTTSSTIFVGIKGSVLALDRATGSVVWSTQLKAVDFVNVLAVDGELYAAARGELYCLDPADGKIRWHNPLKGYGWGLVALAASGTVGDQSAVMRRKKLEGQREAPG